MICQHNNLIKYIYIFGELVYYIVEVIMLSTEKPRYTITVDEEMLKKIDDFRFDNRFPNRTQATLELIRLGMEVLEKKQANKIYKRISK